MQKSSESLHVYVSCYSRLHYAATDKCAHKNMDPMRIYHFVASINNTMIVDKIAKQVQDAARIMQGVFDKALTPGATLLLLTESIHLGDLLRSCKPPWMDQGREVRRETVGVYTKYE